MKAKIGQNRNISTFLINVMLFFNISTYRKKYMCEKTKQLIAYIIDKSPCGITSVIKQCYLIDLAFYRQHGEQITDFEYIRYNYGPFDANIYNHLAELQSEGIIVSHQELTKYGTESVSIYEVKDGSDLSEALFSEDELEIIDRVLDSVEGYGAKALTELAYATGPMKALGATLGGNENLGVKLDLSK